MSGKLSDCSETFGIKLPRCQYIRSDKHPMPPASTARPSNQIEAPPTSWSFQKSQQQTQNRTRAMVFNYGFPCLSRMLALCKFVQPSSCALHVVQCHSKRLKSGSSQKKHKAKRDGSDNTNREQEKMRKQQKTSGKSAKSTVSEDHLQFWIRAETTKDTKCQAAQNTANSIKMNKDVWCIPFTTIPAFSLYCKKANNTLQSLILRIIQIVWVGACWESNRKALTSRCTNSVHLCANIVQDMSHLWHRSDALWSCSWWRKCCL